MYIIIHAYKTYITTHCNLFINTIEIFYSLSLFRLRNDCLISRSINRLFEVSNPPTECMNLCCLCKTC